MTGRMCPQIQILCWSALAFCVLMVTRSTHLNSFNEPRYGLVWRKPSKASFSGWFGDAPTGGLELLEVALQRGGAWVKRHHSPGGVMGEPWPTGSTALWAAILLGLFLLMSL